jgi:HSP20 family protein
MKTKYFNGELLRDSVIPAGYASLFNNFMDNGAKLFQPTTDIVEREKDYTIMLTLPGMVKEEIKVELKNNLLTVSGERKRPEEEKAKYHLMESAYGSFKRTFQLPDNIKRDEISAEFKNGILNIFVPKGDAALNTNIPVK